MSALPKSVWVIVYGDLPERSRKCLARLDAVPCGQSGQGEAYRIAMRGRDFDYFRHYLKGGMGAGWSGPYREPPAHVLRGTGAGTVPKRTPIAVAKHRQLQRDGIAPPSFVRTESLAADWLTSLFGNDWPTLATESPRYWPHEADAYFRLCQWFPQLGGLCNLIDTMLARGQLGEIPADEYAAWLRRASTLERLIAGRYRPDDCGLTADGKTEAKKEQIGRDAIASLLVR